MDADPFLDFDADRLACLRRLDRLMLDLDRVDGLGEVRGVPEDADGVADLELTGEVDACNSQLAVVVADGSDKVLGHVCLPPGLSLPRYPLTSHRIRLHDAA